MFYMTGTGHTPGEQCTGCLLTLKIFPGQEFCLSVSVPRMVPDPEWLCSVSLLLLMKVARATHVEQWPQDKSHLMRVLFCPLHFLQKVTSDLNEQQENFGRETEGNVPEGQLAT